MKIKIEIEIPEEIYKELETKYSLTYINEELEGVATERLADLLNWS